MKGKPPCLTIIPSATLPDSTSSRSSLETTLPLSTFLRSTYSPRIIVPPALPPTGTYWPPPAMSNTPLALPPEETVCEALLLIVVLLVVPPDNPTPLETMARGLATPKNKKFYANARSDVRRRQIGARLSAVLAAQARQVRCEARLYAGLEHQAYALVAAA
jgi:hypothetical protein